MRPSVRFRTLPRYAAEGTREASETACSSENLQKGIIKGVMYPLLHADMYEPDFAAVAVAQWRQQLEELTGN